MPKNKGTMASAKASKEAVAQPDQFVSGVDRVAQTLKPHVRSLIALGVALAVVLIGFSVWQWYGKRNDTRATELYHRALLVRSVPIASAGAAPAETQPDDLRKLPGSFPDAKARGEAVLAVLDELDRDHGGTQATREARLLRAGVLLDLGRADEAAKAFESYAAETGSPALRISALEGVGYAHEARARAATDAAAREAARQAALAAFEAMQPAADGEGRARALYHQGRMLADSKPDEARTRFEEAKSKKPDPALEADIDARLAALGGGAAPAEEAGKAGDDPAEEAPADKPAAPAPKPAAPAPKPAAETE